MKRLTIIILLSLLISITATASFRYTVNRQSLFAHYHIEHLSGAFRQVDDVHLPLVLAICRVESRFDRFAVSRHGDMGIMQVNRYWFPVIMRNWSNPEYNVRIGYSILLDCLSASNSVFGAVTMYNGDRSGGYAKKIMRELKRLEEL
jgi:soluble lytic murein transglycosylase-like protein